MILQLRPLIVLLFLFLIVPVISCSSIEEADTETADEDALMEIGDAADDTGGDDDEDIGG